MASPTTAARGEAAAQHPRRLVILGSTGSIGRQALQIAAAYPEYLQIVGLAAGHNEPLLLEQAERFGVQWLALGEESEASLPLLRRGTLAPALAVIPHGQAAVTALAALDEADCVLNAMVGSVGLAASLAALQSGKRLALANKESLVVGGDLLMPLVQPGQLIPVDSEHSAIFQCLNGEPPESLRRVWLTASGGPFRGYSRQQLATVDVRAALSHPTWQMGAKISIDSATLMNKGLEVIEAQHLFGLTLDQIRIVIQPQSRIHSLVEFKDGSLKGQLGPADMRLAIQYAFSYPQRWPALMAPLDLRELADLSFGSPDLETFGCLRLAWAAAAAGGTLPAVLNAANEVAVAAFLAGQIGFLDIEGCVGAVLAAHQAQPVQSLEQLEALDRTARAEASQFIRERRAPRPVAVSSGPTVSPNNGAAATASCSPATATSPAMAAASGPAASPGSEPRDAQGRSEREFLAGYDASRYPRPAVTVDIVLLVKAPGPLDAEQAQVLLIQRANHPWLGCWALPGGFVNPEETLEQAAARELLEETGLALADSELEQLRVFSDPQRDPRTRVITCAFLAVLDLADSRLDRWTGRLRAGDDAAAAAFSTLAAAQELQLASDHQQILSSAIHRLSD